jgi:CheY-like chemotaxis protein
MRKSRILVVEDDADISDALKDVLTDQGHTVQLARNGKEALVLLSMEVLPQLIFLDLMMPLMDGAQFREAQLRDPRLVAIPVVLLSANRGIEERAQELGVDAWLAKPVSPEAVLEAAERFARAEVAG